ncbi:NrdH-redoxin [Flavobacteriales bacterium 33_180_T64]|nr:NrdH-redoxin [Flavobacteriales bacterium 33_180_T64]
MNTEQVPKIKLYGTIRCHKTQYYLKVLNDTKLPYEFLDVENNKDHAEELRGLYDTRKLNFPTLLIGSKKLRNPNQKELDKWLYTFKTNS